MNQKTHITLCVAILVCIFCVLDILVLNLYWKHQAIIHHAARYETNSWGWSSFKWNDDSAQAPFVDFVNDRLIPPKQ